MPSKHFNTTVAPLIREIKPDDRETVLRIWDREFGVEDEDGQAEFVEAAIGADDPYTFGAVAHVRGQVVGFGIVCRANPEWVADYLRVPIPHEIPNNTAVMHIGCVRSHWQGRGIGTKLFQTRFKWALGNDSPAVVGVSWLRDGRYGSEALFEHFNFDRLTTVERYYLDAFDEPSSCPDCGLPCECDAAIYGWGFGRGEGSDR